MNEISVGRGAPYFGQPELRAVPPSNAAPEDEKERVALLTQYYRMVLRWRWVIAATIVACIVVGTVATMVTTPLYTGTTRIEISRETNKVVNIQGVAPESGPVDLEFFQTQYGLLRSRSLAEQVARNLRLDEDPHFFSLFGEELEDLDKTPGSRLRKAGEILNDHIAISPIRGSRLVDISFTSPEAVLSAKVANAWAAQFIESNLERRFQATSYARKFLEDRLEKLRVKLEESERQLVSYAERQRIINLPAAGGASGVGNAERSLVADDLATFNLQLAEAVADRVKAESEYRESTRAGQGASLQSLNNPALSGLRQKRAEAAGDYAKLLAQFEPDYPAARALADQVGALDKSIAREENRVRRSLQANYESSVTREKDLRARMGALQTALLNLKRRSIQYNIYQRDVDTNRQLYEGLLQRYKEIGIAGGVGTNNVAVVDEADVPLKPSSPRILLNLMLALIAGIVLAVVAMFALEQIDETITNPSDVKDELRLPLLGTIPKLQNGSPIEELKDRKSSIVDAYLAVQTYLALSTEHGVPRTLSVASTRPGEGKSTTAFAVALSLARRGKSALLVDGDMRSPSVHHLVQEQNHFGLSNYLAGEDDYSGSIKATSHDGLAVMTAGPTPPNAAELLAGERFHRLIAILLERYDHVVIDSPPVMGLADAPLIASQVEGTLFTVESHGIRSSLVRVALDRLRSAHARLLGVILTKFDEDRAHFGYGYDYGYGYGRNHGAKQN